MSLLVRSLASGSSGNAFLVRSANNTVLLDAGLSARTLEKRLTHEGIEPQSLTAIVLSHEHHDHAQGVGPLARRHHVPVICTPGTVRALGDLPNLQPWKRGTWNGRMLVETVLSMVTTVCHLKKLRHRTWAALRARLACTMAVFNVVVQWDGLNVDENRNVRLSIAQFSL